MLKSAAMFCFISGLIFYALTIIVPFFFDPNFSFYLFKIAIILFTIGLILGMIHVLNERRKEKRQEDWDKYKDY
jgi:hypothetical protein